MLRLGLKTAVRYSDTVTLAGPALPHLRATSGLQGETAEEVAGLAKAMRARCIHVPTAGDVLDIVGTGGDGIGSVNISTGATVIAAAAGAKVAKAREPLRVEPVRQRGCAGGESPALAYLPWLALGQEFQATSEG